MGRRERLERKLEKRLDWAEGRDKKAAEAYAYGDKYRGDIAFNTQPGHIPERARVIRKTEKAFEHATMAAHHRGAAAGIEHALETSIFSDDPDALDALAARIAELEAKRESMKLVNKLYKKGDAAGLAALGIDLAALTAKLKAAGAYWGDKPHLPYEFSNLSGNIGRLKKRLESIAARNARTAEAEAAPNGVTVKYSKGYDFAARVDNERMYAAVTFAEKPDRAILNDLRAAGFRWGAGYWSGETAKLPASVLALLEPIPAGEAVVESGEEVTRDA